LVFSLSTHSFHVRFSPVDRIWWIHKCKSLNDCSAQNIHSIPTVHLETNISKGEKRNDTRRSNYVGIWAINSIGNCDTVGIHISDLER